MIIGGLTVFLFPYVNEVLIFPVTAIVGLMMMGTMPIIDAMAAKLIPPSCRGKVFGILMTMGIMFGAVSPYITGLIYDTTGNYPMAYVALGSSALLGAGSVFFIRWNRQPETTDRS
jgi:MFS family permease